MFSIVFAASSAMRPKAQLFVVCPKGKKEDLSTYRLYLKKENGELELLPTSNWTAHKEECAYFSVGNATHTSSHIGHYCSEINLGMTSLTDEPTAGYNCILVEGEISDIVEVVES